MKCKGHPPRPWHCGNHSLGVSRHRNPTSTRFVPCTTTVPTHISGLKADTPTGRSEGLRGRSRKEGDSAGCGRVFPVPSFRLRVRAWGQRRSHRPPRLSYSLHGSALVVLAARLLLDACGQESAAGTPWLCRAAWDTRRLGHPCTGETGTRALQSP